MYYKIWTPLLIALLLSAAPGHAAKLYKWTDAKGKVHYSEKPPTAAELEGAVSDEPEETAKPVDPAPVTIPEPTDLAASQQAAELCQQLYRKLESYKGEGPVTDSEGKPTVVSPEMREAKISEINTQLDQSCR